MPAKKKPVEKKRKRRLRRKRRALRDVEKACPASRFVAKLRRLADHIERGERVLVPPGAVVDIEHERGATEEEIEFQLKWKIEV